MLIAETCSLIADRELLMAESSRLFTDGFTHKART